MKAWLEKAKKLFSFGRKKVNPKFEDLADEHNENNIPWWGSFVVEEEQSRFFKIGGIILCLDRYNREWNITSYRGSDLPSDVTTNPSGGTPAPERPKKPYKTFAAQASNEITLKPTLPDRALLSQLDHPFYIPVGETLSLYISSPLWIKIAAGSPATLLDEIPTEILADTWFGKNTLEGELCYANESHCSPRLEDLPRDTTRVISPIMIVNQSRETVLLREIKIPLPELSIYCDAQNYLWTEQLNMYPEDYNSSETVVVKGPPKALKDIQLIQPARFGYKPGLKNLFYPFKMWK
jgi:hypothetical protein